MKMNKPNKLLLLILTTIWLLGGIFAVSAAKAFAQEKGQETDLYKNLRLFNEVLMKLKTNYVEDLNNQTLMTDAINGMLSDVDPHTNFFTPDEFADFTTTTKGEFGGLGIQIDKKGDYITVVSPIEGTPAYKMGIMAGDRIIKVDGVNVVGITTDEVIKKMRGPKDSKVTITISRPGVKDPLDFDIVRDIITIKSVSYAFKLDNGLGYIRINQFNSHTTEELRTALDNLEKQGIKGLIIDLRNNPGGILSEAIDTVNEFIGKDKLVVFTKGRIKDANMEYFTRYDRIRTGYPVIVMINEASASAAEIVAGSLQDWDKALIVGKPSFGKGSVQQIFPLSDGYGMKITTAKYFIKSGRGIHKEINDRILRGKEVTEADKEKAVEAAHKEIFHTVNGRVVYGGGGITPDLVIESPLLTKFEVELRRKNVFFNYSVDYMVKHQHKVSDNFKVDDAIFNDFLTYVKNQGITYTPAELDSARTFMKISLESDVIDKKDDVASYKHALIMDEQFQNTVKLFDKHPTLESLFQYADAQNKARKDNNDKQR
jgi:carboxyl-terminal processing protease